MTLHPRDVNGASRGVGAIHNRDVNNASRGVNAIYVRDINGASRQIYSAAGASQADPSFVFGNAYSASPVTVVTGQTKCTVSGTAYSWASPDSGWAAVNPTSATTAFRKLNVVAGNTYDTTFTCTVTKAGGGTQAVTVQAEVSNNYSGTSSA